jgi:hypothetical protein
MNLFITYHPPTNSILLERGTQNLSIENVVNPRCEVLVDTLVLSKPFVYFLLIVSVLMLNLLGKVY